MSGTWWSAWGLERDPFQGPTTRYVPTSTHEEAIARIRYAVETGLRRICVRGDEGSGKSRVLERAMAEVRHPTRRLVRVGAGQSAAECVRRIVEPLVAARPIASEAREDWSALRRALERCRRQGLRVILAVDEDERLAGAGVASDFWRGLEQAGSNLTIVNAGRGSEEMTDDEQADLIARLVPLGFEESGRYLTEKLGRGGRTGETYTAGALVALHASSEGNPRRLERLASLAMLATGLQHSTLVEREVVEQLTRPGLVA
jgi:general secretion pathway protein A